MPDENKFTSIHQFMFPFYIEADAFSRFNLQIWEDQHSDWQKQPPYINCDNYAARQYFHNEVSRLLWDRYEADSKNIALQHYRYNIIKGKYCIRVHRDEYDEDGKHLGRLDYDYELELDRNGIRLYLLDRLKIGILCLTMYNTQYESDEDVLRINQWGRRIFRPYLFPPCKEACSRKTEHHCRKPDGPADKGDKCSSNCYECADELSLQIELDTERKEWNTCYSCWDAKEEKHRPNYALFITELLGDIDFRHIIDDRMFTCCFHRSQTAGQLAAAWSPYTEDLNVFQPLAIDITDPHTGQKEAENKLREISRAAIDYWYRLSFVDIGITCANPKMKYDLLQKVTYPRWADWGTFYAYTRYSFILFAAPGYPSYLEQHFLQHYHYMTIILLLQRASLISFSDQVNALADKHIISKERIAKLTRFNLMANIRECFSRDEKQHSLGDRIKTLFHKPECPDLLDELTDFRKDYILFVNKVWFEEVSPQEQGIEMYNIAKNVMELEKQKDILRRDIEELYQFSKTEEADKQSKPLNLISELGSITLPLGLWSTLLLAGSGLLYRLLADTSLLLCSLFLLTRKKSRKFKLYLQIIFGLYGVMAIAHFLVPILSKVKP
jgi:hypothetical protein